MFESTFKLPKNFAILREFFAQGVVLRRRFGGCFSLETTCPSCVSRSPPRWRGSDLARSNNRQRPAAGGRWDRCAVTPSRWQLAKRAFQTRRRVRRPGDQQAESRLSRSHRARIRRSEIPKSNEPSLLGVSARAIVLTRHLLNSFGITKFVANGCSPNYQQRYRQHARLELIFARVFNVR